MLDASNSLLFSTQLGQTNRDNVTADNPATVNQWLPIATYLAKELEKSCILLESGAGGKRRHLVTMLSVAWLSDVPCRSAGDVDDLSGICTRLLLINHDLY